jgi:alpha-tubulin suppressor-like RCC1 family protein
MKAKFNDRSFRNRSRALWFTCLCLLSFALSASGQQDYVVAMGDDYGAAVDDNGSLFVWGAILGGSSSGTVEQILPAGVWKEVSVSRTDAGNAHVLAIRTNGTLWAFGSNARGQLGDGTTIDRETPVQIASAITWEEVAAGQYFSMARKSNGDLYVWGDNRYGQLGVGPLFGDPNQDIRKSPSSKFDDNAYIEIAAGKHHAHAIRADGTLWAWGTGEQAELGILVSGNIPFGPVLPVQVGTSANWTDLFSGWNATFGLQTSGSQVGQLWVWGTGGNLGRGQGASLITLPERVGTGLNWASVSASQEHTLALKADGTLYGWGSNQTGQLGLPIQDNQGRPIISNYQVYSPVQLEAADSFLAVGAGEGFSALIRTDGFMLTSGRNEAGQLANGSINTSGGYQYFYGNSNLGIADLEATSLVLNTQVPAIGAPVNVAFSLKNRGTGTVTTDFFIQVVLSSDATFDDSDTVLNFSGGGTTFAVTQDFNSGANATIPLSIDLPAQILQGNYYLIVRADATGLVIETDEGNNVVTTAESFEFLSDLIFTDLIGLDLGPLATSYDPGDPMEIAINIENDGAGYIQAGTEFDIRIFLSSDQTTTNSQGVDLNSEFTVTLASDFLPSDELAFDLDVNLPFGLGTGAYFLGGVIDVNEAVIEQTELLSESNFVLRVDGEANNEFYTDTAKIIVEGISLDEAMDLPGRAFTTSGDATWFGQDQEFTTDSDAAQSPTIEVGETAAFATTFTDPVIITFDWRALTSSAENKLVYRVVGAATGAGVNEISGDTGGWLSAQKVVPANTQVEWEYVKGVDAAGDAVYVDNLELFVIDKPELVIDGINLTSNGLIVDSGTYVLTRDRLDLNINSRNQGGAPDLLDDFVISVYLSTDRNFNRPDGNPATPDDRLIRQFTEVDIFEGGNSAVNGLSINLPLDMDPGAYYVIAYIDDYTDGNGDPLTGTLPGLGQIDEFTDKGFPGETNNLFISIDPVVEIVALPDLVVTEANPVPGYYLVKDEEGNPDKIDFDFIIANQGLSAVNEDIRVRVLLSTDVEFDPDNDYVVLDYLYTGGLSAGGPPAGDPFALADEVVPGSVVNVDPDAVDIRTDVPIGELFYFGVYIDAIGAIEEANEANNGFIFQENDFVFSEVSLAEALDISKDAPNVEIKNATPPFDTSNTPWVGQSTTTFDQVDAAMSVNIGNNATSAFETTISIVEPTIVSFRWKVSSQDDEFGRDSLNFYVDNILSDTIAGIEGGWQKVSLPLAVGSHTLRWAYIKDNLYSIGQDRGWVDDFSFQVPNLKVDSLAVDNTTKYFGGDTIDTWSVTVANDGLADVSPTPPFNVQIRISKDDNTWGNAGDYVLLTLRDNKGLAVDESRTYSEATHGPLTIPEEVSQSGSYYFGAYVDWSDPDSSTDPIIGAIFESDEDDNIRFAAATAGLTIATTVELNEAIDEFSLDLEVGASGWFGLDTLQIDGGASDSVDAAKSGIIASGETSYLQALVEGPAVLTFNWKVSSRENDNVLQFLINGDVARGIDPSDSDRELKVAEISGEIDWTPIEIFIPAGTQELRWSYRKTADAGDFEDAAWLDQVLLTPFNDPELAVINVNYTPGEYVLDVAGIAGEPNQLLGTEYLDITVEAENQGGTLTGDEFTVADIEVRLSENDEYGDADDIVLGTVSQVEGSLEAGDVIRFLGPIQLGDSIPDGFYYLMARIDSNEEVDEYTEKNNIWKSFNKDIQITRRPALRIYNPNTDLVGELPTEDRFWIGSSSGITNAPDVDDELFYYTESPMRLRYAVQNIGLGRVDGSVTWRTQINLRGAEREDLSDAQVLNDRQAFIDAFDVSIVLGDFSVQELLEGRSDTKPTGDIIEFDIDLALPSEARLNDVIEAPSLQIPDYLWIIEIVLDSTDVVVESEIVRESNPAFTAPADRPWWLFNPIVGLTSDVGYFNTDMSDGIFGINFQPPTITAAAWEDLYPGHSIQLEVNQLAYAFNRNPDDSDTAGNQFPGTVGVTAFEEGEYASIAFDIVTRAADLVYTVEATPTMDPPDWKPIVAISGPFDELTGPASLTGDGGLIDEENVISVLDQGYSARITVKDHVDLGSPSVSGRFMRVLVEFDPSVSSPDADSDGVSNIAELFYGSDPTDAGDTPVLTPAQIFVAEQLSELGISYVGAADFAPSDDYDSDGVDNLTELIAGSNPIFDTDLPTAVEEYVAAALIILGVVSPESTSPIEDYDFDGISNIAELLYGSDPTDGGDTASVDAVQAFVVEQMSQIGVFDPLTTDFAPSDDFDFDGISNLVELLYGTDPTASGSVPEPVVDDLDIFVAEEMADAGALLVGISNVGPNQDFDSDGIPNVVELLYATNPNDSGDTPVLSSLEVTVAEQMAAFLAAADLITIGAPNIGPADDYDGNSINNIDEINQGGNPGLDLPPAFTVDPFSKADALEAVAYSASIADDASNSEPYPITFSKVSGPAWLSVAPDGILSGTPGVGDVGLNAFIVRVSSINGSGDATLNITVNGAPFFTSDPLTRPNATVFTDYFSAGPYSIRSNATDPEGDPMIFSKVSGPAWLEVSPEGTLTGMPSPSDVGLNVFTVKVETFDGSSSSDTATLNIRVSVLEAPFFTSDPFSEVNATVGVNYSVTGATIEDDASDPQGDPMTFLKLSGPAWLSVAPDGTLSGTPGVGDVGLIPFIVEVKDADGNIGEATLNITVDP